MGVSVVDRREKTISLIKMVVYTSITAASSLAFAGFQIFIMEFKKWYDFISLVVVHFFQFFFHHFKSLSHEELSKRKFCIQLWCMSTRCMHAVIILNVMKKSEIVKKVHNQNGCSTMTEQRLHSNSTAISDKEFYFISEHLLELCATLHSPFMPEWFWHW